METFENGDSSFSCGRSKPEVFKYDNVMPRFKARSSAHTIRKRLGVDADFFKYGEKHLRFPKYTAMYGWSNTIQNCYVWTQISYFNTEKKIPVLENIRLHVDDA